MSDSQVETILAFDLGLKRTGVAVGQTINKTANALKTLPVNAGKLNWENLDTLIHQWQPSVIIVGAINKQNPHLHKLSRRFKHHIQQHKIRLIEVNEALTTEAANAELKQRLNQKAGRNKIKKVRDQLAACLILETHLNDKPATIKN